MIQIPGKVLGQPVDVIFYYGHGLVLFLGDVFRWGRGEGSRPIIQILYGIAGYPIGQDVLFPGIAIRTVTVDFIIPGCQAGGPDHVVYLPAIGIREWEDYTLGGMWLNEALVEVID